MGMKSLVVAPLKHLAREVYRRSGTRSVVGMIVAEVVVERLRIERRVSPDGESLVADGDRVVIRSDRGGPR